MRVRQGNTPTSGLLPYGAKLSARPRRASSTNLAALVQTYLVLSPVLEQTTLLSGWFGKLLGLACAGLLMQALLRFKRWGDETPQAGRFFAVFAALLVELTIDNAFTWYCDCSGCSSIGC